MSNGQFSFEALDSGAKRELLARLLRERAIASDQISPLSLGQEDIWLLHEMAPESATYSVPFCVRLRSPVDCARLERSLRSLLQRHEILRCTFEPDTSGPRQRVGQLPERCLELIDASGWSEEELKRRVNESYRRPFDLSRGPVFRATLFTRPQGDILLLSAHHIVFDAWSLGLLLADLALLYDGGTQAALPPEPPPYTRFVDWQRSMIESVTGRDAWSYWRSRLQNALTPVSLPTDHPRPNVLSLRGAAHRFEIPASLAMPLRQLARAQNATPFALMATAFHALLHRYTGAPEIPIGTPLSGRSQGEFQNTVGYFVNPVILCAPVTAATTFRQHLADMRETIIAAQEHGDFPFIELVRRLRPERDTSRTPLFQVMLNLIKATQVGVAGDMLYATRGQDLRLGSLQLEAYPLEQQEGQFDLDLTLLDTGGAMPASLTYNTDLFEPETAARIARNFLTLLSAAIAAPDRKIADLPLLAPDEQAQVLVDWNATARPYPDTTIHRLFEEEVRRSPDATALVFEGRTMSYSELNRRANQLANYLRGAGVGPETLVAVCMERSFEMVIALLGIIKAGGAYVPVDSGYPAERQAYMIRDACAPLILTQVKFAGRMSNLDAAVLALDADWNRVSDQPCENLAGGAEPNHLAYVIYTSGSTGQPKGAMNTHRAVCNRLLWMQDEYALTASDRVLQKTPFSFDVSVWEFFWPLMTGARLVLARPEGHKDAAYLARLIREEDITTLHFVPSMLRVFLETEGAPECASVKRVICSGEALPYQLQERFFELLGAQLHNLYGPTEAAVDVTYWACQRSGARAIVPIGRPVANTRIYILDANMQPVPVGVPGELHIGGVQVGRGYWRRPDLTEERFIPDPFRSGGRLYRTGDLARWLPDGAVEYLGRLDHQVKIRGFRIEPGEIESLLAQDSGVKQAIVVAREDATGDRRLVAYIAARNGDAPQIADLKAMLSTRVPDYMVPSAFMYLDAFPLTPNGKVDRKALPVPEYTCPVGNHGYQAPETEVATAIAAIWKEVLRVPRVGIHDNFFDLGGHSLLAVGVLSRVRERYGIELPLRTVFEAPTVQFFAGRIETLLWAAGGAGGARDETEEREEIEI
jgi:amino acid adenylation domain-containing protein